MGRDVRRREALTYLVGAGTVIRAIDRVQRRAVLFHREAVASARTRLVEAFPNAATAETGFLAREAGATLGISRKFSIPLLEHLDATGFTRRAGDRRVIVGLDPDGAGGNPGQEPRRASRRDRARSRCSRRAVRVVPGRPERRRLAISVGSQNERSRTNRS